MWFQIESELVCDETYIFPDHHLLLNAKYEQMKSIKDIFRKDSKMETLNMEFTPNKLTIGGVVQTNATYEIQSTGLNRYGTYLAKNAEVASNFMIKVPLKYVLSVIRITEINDGDICFAMEVFKDGNACCFFFTKSRDFTFNIAVGSVAFENRDAEMLDTNQIAGIVTDKVPGVQRLKRQVDESMADPGSVVKNEVAPSVKKEVTEHNQQKVTVKKSAPPSSIKQESVRRMEEEPAEESK